MSHTSLPRWTSDPRPGSATHRRVIDPGLVPRLEHTAATLVCETDALLVAALAHVVSRLADEAAVTVGHVAAPDRSEPVRLHVEAVSWAALVGDAARAVGVGGSPAASLGSAECLVLGAGVDHHPDDLDAVLTVSLRSGELVLEHDTEVLDPGAAARLAGYLERSLGSLVHDPTGRADATALVDAAELDHQVRGLAGPVVALPDQRVHDLVLARVADDPDRVAVVHRGRSLTYREVAERAHRVAHALLREGLRPEQTVAVLTERDPDWMVAVLGVLAAGGVYLPVEPGFPADRVATTLRRADCSLVLTQSDCEAALDAALASDRAPERHVRRLLVDDLARPGRRARPGDDVPPDVAVTAGQAAYVYFTSGSTGQPKGAVCEHAGMLNHLLAKIEDLPVREGAVVAQLAPQCFDISLWQLVAGLLVGGRTVIVDRDVQLDTAAMLRLLADEGVEVLQVVPSYLEVLLSALDAEPRPLPALRVVSVTGEAVKHELVARFFATLPEVSLVNAYGLTETSDDTNHEVMHAPPEGARVPVGRPVRNTRVYVVGPDLRPVPLGAPGEIVFSGVCVGRGYVNDPERTAAAFVPDPLVPGARLYRSGDFGRWRPDGSLDFLGRRDTQVKISGFRIEIGEIENTLLTVPGVRDGAVVAAALPDGSRSLVGFYVADGPVGDDVVRQHLARHLPPYMVPSTLHQRSTMPLSDNGKTDRRALLDAATALLSAPRAGTPVTDGLDPVQRRVAAAWGVALGLSPDDFLATDDFLGRGGSSLAAVKVVVELGRVLSLREVVETPVLADQALLLAERAGLPPGPPPVTPPVPAPASRD